MRMLRGRYMRPRAQSIRASEHKGRSGRLGLTGLAARRKELTNKNRQRRLGAGEKGERPAEIKRGQADPCREYAVDSPLAEAGRKPAQQTATYDMLYQIVGQREAAGNRKMAD